MNLAAQQQAMLEAVFGRWDDASLRGAVIEDDGRRVRGLQAYRSNGHAVAQRALTAAFPVVAGILEEENFGALARAFWHACPPVKGDMAQWGVELAAFMAAAHQLAGQPHLPDVARVEWAMHASATAHDVAADAASFGLLTQYEPERLWLVGGCGLHLVQSGWPAATIVTAGLDGMFDIDDLLARRPGGETAVVWRRNFKPELRAALPGEGAFIAAMLEGRSLAACLNAAMADAARFDFNAWLAPAFQCGLVVGARIHPT
ncbi:MAG: hypothetical protein EOO28_35375 [Comamonadaceae bacterium]|nr:MAG: hypothetical protein EOO28_35375 [Comamonadaceae bacterium]